MRGLLFVCVVLFYSDVYSASLDRELLGESVRSDGEFHHTINSEYKRLKNKLQQKNRVRVIVKYSDQADLPIFTSQYKSKIFEERKLKLEKKGLHSKKDMRHFNMAVYEVSRIELDELIFSGEIENLQEDFAVPPTVTESVSFVRADQMHALGFMGGGYSVAILDTGIETGHVMLAGRVVEEACFSSNTDDSVSMCPNGGSFQFGVGSGINCSVSEFDICKHGTHVAGIISGVSSVTNSESGEVVHGWNGVAPQANVVSVQVFSEFNNFYSDCDGAESCVLSYTSDQLAALEWVFSVSDTHNIAAVNMSLGGGEYTDFCDDDIRSNAILQLRLAGVATVISAGNDSLEDAVGAPACISHAITVSSVDRASDDVSPFSNSALMVDVLAPGERIVSAVPNGLFGRMSGTSMAAPHVAGAIALLRSINPYASVDYIEQHIKDYGIEVTDTANELTFPRLDVFAAGSEMRDKPMAGLSELNHSIIIGQEASFDGGLSSDPNDDALNYIWSFGDGQVSEWSTSSQAVYNYSETGTYDVSLVVANDLKESDPTTARVTVYDPVIITIIITSILL